VPQPRKYEDAITRSSDEYSKYFPFEVANLDFVSQDLTSTQGRMEKEISSVEATFKLQRECGVNSLKEFVIIYTTKMDNNNLDLLGIKAISDRNNAAGWAGLDISGCPNVAVTSEEKVQSIRKLLEQFARKYGCTMIGYDYLTADDIHSMAFGVTLDGSG
jgi:hypothetical protein